ncbi:MAG: hypothetical protein ACXVPF_10960 [Bacteroidia bacterium]
MKVFIALAISMTLLTSCSAEKSKEETSVAVKKDSLVSERDTFYIGNKLFYVEQISKEEFDKLPGPPVPDTSEKNILVRDSAYAFRLGTALVLNMGERFNETISFKDNNKEASEEYCGFTYKGFLPQINRHLVFASFIESFNYYLIDKNTADTNYACGYPVFSPTGKYFVCGNTDLVARFVPNGFDLYEAGNKKIKQIGRRELDTWGPEKVKWLNDSVLCVQRNVLDTTTKNMVRTDYVKLLIR